MSRVLRLMTLAIAYLVAVSSTLLVSAGPVIIDVDGSVESMAALATLVAHPATTRNILLVTVTGTGWATLTVAENNVRAFLRLANRDDIAIGVGTSSTMGDIPDVSRVDVEPNTPGGSCDDHRLFPPTPAMAAARGLKRSRFDEDDLYGAADALPTPTDFGTKAKEATAQMSTIYNQLAPNTRVAYIATAGLATLARFIKFGNTNAVNTMLIRTDVHIYENENNLPLDVVGSALVFEKQSIGLTATLYTPAMLAGVRFSPMSWNSFQVAARSSSSKPYVSWLFSALHGRKNAISGGVSTEDELNGGAATPGSIDFYTNDMSLGAAFVAMAVADVPTQNAGKSLLSPTNENRKRVQFSTVVVPTLPGLSSLTIKGNNVTRGCFLTLIPMPGAAPGGGVTVITESATKVSAGMAISMLDTFWAQWRSVMFA